MVKWVTETTDKFERKYKEYEKKHKFELQAVLVNLNKYFEALQEIGNPKVIKAGYIHPEPMGIIAIDQKGGKKKVKLKETRLYLYCGVENNIVYLITLGDKKSQSKDIEYSKSFVKKIRKDLGNG